MDLLEIDSIDDTTPTTISGTVRLHIEGMMCQKNCGTTVFNAVESVLSVHTNLKTELNVSFDDSEAMFHYEGYLNPGCTMNKVVQNIISEIEDVGFDANVKHTEHDIGKGRAQAHESTELDPECPVFIETKKAMANPSISTDENANSIPKNNGIPSYFVLEIVIINCTTALSTYIERSIIPQLMKIGDDAGLAIGSVGKRKTILSIVWIPLSDRLVITFDTTSITVKQFHDCILAHLNTYNQLHQHEKNYLDVCMLSSGITKPVDIPEDISDSTSKNEYFFEISGMSCANCSGKIEKSVSKLDGVVYVSVSCVTNTANVIVIGHSTGLRDLIEHITKLGYPCKYVNNTGSNYGSNVITATETDAAGWYQSLMICLVFGIPVLLLHTLMSTANRNLFSSLITVKHTLNASNPLLCNSNVPYIHVVMLVLNIPIQFLGGLRFYKGALMGAVNGSYGMDALVVTGTTIIFVYSCIEMILVCDRDEPSAHVFFEAAGMLLLFVTMGKYIESYTKGKSASAVAKLLECQPTKALLVTTIDGTEWTPEIPADECRVEEIAVELIQVGDIVKIMPGASIPGDGVIVHCPTHGVYVDNSLITGESEPVLRGMGDAVHGSTTNLQKMFYIRVSSCGQDSALAQIVRIVQNAQLNKAPIQAYADKIANKFAPLVLFLSLLTFVSWYVLCLLEIVPADWYIDSFGGPFLFSLLFAVSVIVTSCPCALGLATPMALIAGSNVASKLGLLIKGGNIFEITHKVNNVVFDKTGTLTLGKLKVTDVVPWTGGDRAGELLNNHSKLLNMSLGDVLLYYAACAEQGSEHGIATAVLNAGMKLHVGLIDMNRCDFDSSDVIEGDMIGTTPEGRGICCTLPAPSVMVAGTTAVDKFRIVVGNEEWLQFKGVTLPVDLDTQSKIDHLREQGKTVVFVAIDKTYLGCIGITDPIRPEASHAIRALSEMGIDVWLMTGDHKHTVKGIARRVGIVDKRCISNMLPRDKLEQVKLIQLDPTAVVAMVGDGVNDAPALTQANVGIAIGAGTHIAIEAADIVLVRNNLMDVVVCVDLAKSVFRRIKCNLIWALIYNTLAIPFAAGVYFPWTHSSLAPQYAGLLMAISSVSVVLSSVALQSYAVPKQCTVSSTECVQSSLVEEGELDKADIDASYGRSHRRWTGRWFLKCCPVVLFDPPSNPRANLADVKVPDDIEMQCHSGSQSQETNVDDLDDDAHDEEDEHTALLSPSR